MLQCDTSDSQIQNWSRSCSAPSPFYFVDRDEYGMPILAWTPRILTMATVAWIACQGSTRSLNIQTLKTNRHHGEASRIQLGPFLESYTIGSFGASFFGTRSFSRLGAGGSTKGGQCSQTPSQQHSRFLPRIWSLKLSMITPHPKL